MDPLAPTPDQRRRAGRGSLRGRHGRVGEDRGWKGSRGASDTDGNLQAAFWIEVALPLCSLWKCIDRSIPKRSSSSRPPKTAVLTAPPPISAKLSRRDHSRLDRAKRQSAEWQLLTLLLLYKTLSRASTAAAFASLRVTLLPPISLLESDLLVSFTRAPLPESYHIVLSGP